MSKQRNDPRISVNKLAQYVTSRAARQTQILRNAKFPPDYITTYYREAAEAISRYLASDMQDAAILEPIREVWIHDEGFAASRLSMMRIMARRTKAATVVA
jgi:hypothetical protein